MSCAVRASARKSTSSTGFRASQLQTGRKKGATDCSLPSDGADHVASAARSSLDELSFTEIQTYLMTAGDFWPPPSVGGDELSAGCSRCRASPHRKCT